MRLVNPGAGEMTDRLTILTLKILYGGAADKSVAHFIKERDTLLAQVKGRVTGAWFADVLELGALNGALWAAEDRLRAFRTAASPFSMEDAIIETAFTIQVLNDQRAVVIQRINTATGEDYGAEKL